MTITATYDAPIRRPESLFIGGEWVAPSSDAQIHVITPITEQLYVTVAEAQEADINRAVASARDAFDRGPWPRLTHAERARYLRAIGAALTARADDASRIWTSEMGILHAVSSDQPVQAGGAGEDHRL